MQMIYAHRGASGYAPENTLRAFDLAADMHADGVEIDVQRTKDGRLVVFHDETLERVTKGTGLISEYTYDELKKYPLLYAVDGTEEDTIPLFSDVLTLLRKRGLRLNVELKNSRNPYPGMEEEVLQTVREADMVEQTMYSSFNHYSLLHIKALQPGAFCGILYEASLVHPWRYAASLGMDALHPQYAEPMLIERSEVKEAHLLHLEVNPWIVNDTGDIRECISLGCDRIISNYPDRAVSILNQCKPRD
ncbi:MAG: glycerophosphodiester phosphodiesterase [Clostridia bacterium]|nr:glycerophosphodiester phosphodiesterase [Clostridia bacterium]